MAFEWKLYWNPETSILCELVDSFGKIYMIGFQNRATMFCFLTMTLIYSLNPVLFYF